MGFDQFNQRLLKTVVLEQDFQRAQRLDGFGSGPIHVHAGFHGHSPSLGCYKISGLRRRHRAARAFLIDRPTARKRSSATSLNQSDNQRRTQRAESLTEGWNVGLLLHKIADRDIGAMRCVSCHLTQLVSHQFVVQYEHDRTHSVFPFPCGPFNIRKIPLISMYE
jgi:hypothetical protein